MFTTFTLFAAQWFWPMISAAAIGWIGYEIKTKLIPIGHKWLEAKAEHSNHQSLWATVEKAYDALAPLAELAVGAAQGSITKGAMPKSAKDAENMAVSALANVKTMVGPAATQSLTSLGITDTESALRILIDAAIAKQPTSGDAPQTTATATAAAAAAPAKPDASPAPAAGPSPAPAP